MRIKLLAGVLVASAKLSKPIVALISSRNAGCSAKTPLALFR
jgi:hypothetical protein